MRYLGPDDVRRALPMEDAIGSMRDAFGADWEAPERVKVGVSLFMPGRVGDATAVKVVSTVPGDPAGVVVVFGPDGHPLGLVDGPSLTAIRTAAAPGLATDLLARPDARVLAMLGAGAMAADQVAAVRAVRRIEEVLVWSRTPDNAARFAERIGGRAVSGAAEAVAAADVVSTATPARAPLFPDGVIRPGTHVNAVGAFTPEMVELPPGVVTDAFVLVDDVAAASVEAGDLIQAGREPDGTLGDLLAGRVAAPTGGITIFKSVGVASQDVAAGRAALERAAREGIGIEF